MAKDDCDAIMFDTFLEPLYQGKPIKFLFKSNLIYLLSCINNYLTIHIFELQKPIH